MTWFQSFMDAKSSFTKGSSRPKAQSQFPKRVSHGNSIPNTHFWVEFVEEINLFKKQTSFHHSFHPPFAHAFPPPTLRVDSAPSRLYKMILFFPLEWTNSQSARRVFFLSRKWTSAVKVTQTLQQLVIQLHHCEPHAATSPALLRGKIIAVWVSKTEIMGWEV